MFRLRPKTYKNWILSTEASMDVEQHATNTRHVNRQAGRRIDGDTSEPLCHARDTIEQCDAEITVMDDDTFDNSTSESHDSGEQTDGSTSEEEKCDSSSSFTECDCCRCMGQRQLQPQDNDEAENESVFNETRAFVDKLHLNEDLSPHCNVTKFEVLLMILAVVMRHGMTGCLVEDLLSLINKIFGRDILPKSTYMFQKLFSVDSSLNYHFICPLCNLYLGDHKSFTTQFTDCPNCGHKCNVKPSTLNEGNFFITLSIRQQLQDLMTRAGQHIKTRTRKENNDISDVQDGLLYKSLCAEGMPLSNPFALTLTIGTDGGNVFNNANMNSMWPCQIICNELDPSERFRPENMLLGALWFGKTSPDMSAFLRPLANELKDLEKSGVSRTLSDGSTVTCPVYTIMCVCDSVAKPKIQNMVQFNGYYGCGYCLHPESQVADCSQVRFPNGEKYRLRSQESIRRAMTIAEETNTVENGVKGRSPLLLFTAIHLVFGIPIDYMHAILLGVVKRLVNLWFDEASHHQKFYIKRFENEVDNRLSGVILPSRISTRPKLISKRAQWKAKDWGHFLLVFGLPSLNGILPTPYLENFRDLSNGIYIYITSKYYQSGRT